MAERPALVVLGTSSGCGKTTVAKGLVHLFRRRGLSVQPFKFGPDFIDAGHLQAIAGRATVNLDAYLLTPPGAPELDFDALRAEMIDAVGDADAVVAESVGGLCDDWFHDGTSPAAITRRLGLPGILVLDGLACCQTLGIMVDGLLRQPRLELAGVIVNRVVSEDHYRRIVEPLSPEHRDKLLGFVLHDPAFHVPERHLGLTTARELEAGPAPRFPVEAFAAHLDTERIFALTAELPRSERAAAPPPPKRCRIAVARDEAFSFYYRYNLAALEAAGAELVEFSPLADDGLPGEVDALYLGGGFPEMHLERLSGNRRLRLAVARAAAAGMPIYAECGGLIYLAEEIHNCAGDSTYPGAGVLPLSIRFSPRLTLDYVECRITRRCLLGEAGDKVRGHVFHASRAEPRGELTPAYELELKTAARVVAEGWVTGNVLASYAHLHFRSCPRVAENLVASAVSYRQRAVEPVGA